MPPPTCCELYNSFLAESEWAKSHSKGEIPSKIIVEEKIIAGDINFLVTE